MFNAYSQDSGKLLIHAGALGWLFSSLAQVSVIATDDKISKKDKKFLVPQEICDGATNVALYYTVSKVIKSSGDWLINHGHLLTDDVHDALELIKKGTVTDRECIKSIIEDWKMNHLVVSKSENQKLLKAAGDTTSKVAPGKILADECKKPLKAIFDHYDMTKTFTELSGAQQKLVKEKIGAAAEKIGTFKNGVGVITTVLASILASNILTPIARNKMAGIYQQNFLMKEDAARQASEKKPTYPVAMPKPVSNAFQAFNTSGGMKI